MCTVFFRPIDILQKIGAEQKSPYRITSIWAVVQPCLLHYSMQIDRLRDSEEAGSLRSSVGRVLA